MKKTNLSKSCTFCHLKYLIPLKRHSETLFTGIMKKGVKKHELKFMMPSKL
jgi:hypothetical protein